MASARFLVSGRVQGVFFRASTQMRALGLGLTGFARNCTDGRVEVIASGPLPVLAELEAWLRIGPPSAQVDAVERTAAPAQDHAGLATL